MTLVRSEQAYVSRALQIAVEAFGDQADKVGRPAILHSLRLGLRGRTPEEQATGFLHDVLEDTAVTMADLRAEGVFPEAVLVALEAVTRRKAEGERYREFIDRIVASNDVAIVVKLFNLEDNFARSAELPAAEAASLARRREIAWRRVAAEAARRGLGTAP